MFFPLHCTFHQRGKEIRQEEYERKENQEELLVKICCYCSVAKSCPTLYDPMDCKMPGFPVLHYLPAFAQTHVHWISDAIQPSHPLSPSSPLAFNLSQHQGFFFPVSWLFTWGSQSIGALASASVLPMSIQGWFPLGLTGLISLLSKGLSRVFSSTTVQKHQFFVYQTYKLWDRGRGSHQRCLSRCVWKV